MIVFIIIIFGFATIRTIVPLSQKENYNIATISVALLTIVAYVMLLNFVIK